MSATTDSSSVQYPLDNLYNDPAFIQITRPAGLPAGWAEYRLIKASASITSLSSTSYPSTAYTPVHLTAAYDRSGNSATGITALGYEQICSSP